MTGWRRPSLCGGNGECIEVRAANDINPSVLLIRRLFHGRQMWSEAVLAPEFAAFIAAAKNGEYDDLTREATP